MAETESRFIDSTGMTEEEAQPFLTYLDNLHNSSVTKWLVACSDMTEIAQTFDVTPLQARAILRYWMDTYMNKGVSE